MKSQTQKTLLATLTLLAVSTAVLCQGATVLFDNGGPLNGGFVEDADSADPYGLTMTGNVFTPTVGTAYVLTFAGSYLGGSLPATDNFQISLYAVDGGGSPTGTPFVTSLINVSRSSADPLISTQGGAPIYSFTGDLAAGLDFNLPPGTSYYLGISDVGDGEDFGLLDSAGLATNRLAYNSLSSPGFGYTFGFNQLSDQALSFTLSTPEPHTWVFGVMSIGALILVVRRRARLLAK